MFFSFQQFKYLSNELEQFYSSSSSSSSSEKKFFRVQVQVRVRQTDRVFSRSSSSSSSQPWNKLNVLLMEKSPGKNTSKIKPFKTKSIASSKFKYSPSDTPARRHFLLSYRSCKFLNQPLNMTLICC